MSEKTITWDHPPEVRQQGSINSHRYGWMIPHAKSHSNLWGSVLADDHQDANRCAQWLRKQGLQAQIRKVDANAKGLNAQRYVHFMWAVKTHD